jgi:trehalose 6-phosphate synthase/phosphatase
MGPARRARNQGALIVISNRLPYDLPKVGSKGRPKRNVGGLVNALEPVLAAGDGSWIGWDGHSVHSTSELSAELTHPPHFRTETGVDLYGVPLSDREMARYYHGLSNRTLWPLLHSLLDKTVYNTEDYASYVRVNRRFAEVTLAHAAENDRVWVHDYHLMLVPAYLREMGFRGRIDFFLHIPFPAPEIFRALPWREDLIGGLLASDTVAFHVGSYRDNFARVVEGLYEGRIKVSRQGDDVLLRHEAGTTLVGAAPIGIDVDQFERLSNSKRVQTKAQSLIRAQKGPEIVFGADRLDYTKGIKERLLGVERLLERHPDRAGSFIMLQVLVPSRHQVEEYRVMKQEIDQTVGRINGEHGKPGWVPIHYQYRALNREDLVAHYRAASVALITPLRDGMNLVAPEFVASRTDDDGVLILSEFAGVAEQFPEALLVNPYDLDGCADAIVSALDMPPVERAARMQGLRQRIRENTVQDWAKHCLSMGDSPKRRRDDGASRAEGRVRKMRRSSGPADDAGAELAERVARAGRRSGAARTLLLDLDGTLAPIAPTPDAAAVPERTLAGLRQLLGLDWTVAIVSGRPAAQVRAMVPMRGIKVFGSHGMEGSWSGSETRPARKALRRRLGKLGRAAEKLAEGTPGVLVERKPAGIAFHDRKVGPERLSSWRRKLRKWLGAQDLEGLEQLRGKRVLELRPEGVNKGLVVEWMPVAADAPSPDRSLVAMGDDETDEDLFRALQGRGLTVRVGGPRKESAAEVRLPSPLAVQRFLIKLADLGG